MHRQAVARRTGRAARAAAATDPGARRHRSERGAPAIVTRASGSRIRPAALLQPPPRLVLHEIEHADETLTLAHRQVPAEDAEDDLLRHPGHELERLAGERFVENRRPRLGGEPLRPLDRDPQAERAVRAVESPQGLSAKAWATILD